MKKPIYLDNHATTPLDPRVLAAMQPFLNEEFGNAASHSHTYGWRAKAAVEKARASVASLVGARGDEIIFTSGATESNNWVLLSTLSAGDHVVTTAFEHKSVLCCLEHLKNKGVTSTPVSLNSDGQISEQDILSALTPQTKLICVMMANNEIGSVLPIANICRVAKANRVLFLTDAVQAAGKLRLDVNELGVDFLSLSAHKIYGPKGVGALYVRRELKAKLTPLIFGGGQEQGLRAGTINVPAIVGFGAACDLAAAEFDSETTRIKGLRDRLWKALQASSPEVRLNGSLENRLCGNLNVSFGGVDGEMMLMALQNDIAVSVGSACSSGGPRGSHVLTAIGVSPDRIQASFRIGIGRFNTEEEIDQAAKVLLLAESRARC
jgi:cysteine desulfurase